MPKGTPSTKNWKTAVWSEVQVQCLCSSDLISTSAGCQQAPNSRLCTELKQKPWKPSRVQNPKSRGSACWGLGTARRAVVDSSCRTWQRLKMSASVTRTLKCFRTCSACSFAFSEQFTEKHLPSPTWDCSLKRQGTNQKKWETPDLLGFFLPLFPLLTLVWITNNIGSWVWSHVKHGWITRCR